MSNGGRAGVGALLVAVAVVVLQAVLTIGSAVVQRVADISPYSPRGGALSQLLLASATPYLSLRLDHPEVRLVVSLVVAALVAAVVVALVTWLAARSPAPGSGGLSLWLGSWFSVVLGTAIGGLVFALVLQASVIGRDGYATTMVLLNTRSGVAQGAYWGLLFGWLPALLALVGRPRRLPPPADSEFPGPR